jgi:predicted short-subunit dehydrogenase-like oxidoreductase (DUF2520 family)
VTGLERPRCPLLDETHVDRALALVGPGRAGTAVALRLSRRGWSVRAVAGRAPDAPSTRRVAALLDAPCVDAADAGRDADLVVIATPDAAIAPAATAVAPSLCAGALVVHLSGAAGPEALDGLRVARPDVRTGVLHPLQALPSPEAGAARLEGAWCAVDGSATEALAADLGLRPFRLPGDPAARRTYHAAACVASNHVVALLGQVERLAASCGVPFDAFLPLVRASVDNVADLGAATALTGPVARGDTATVVAHLDALPAGERNLYVAVARGARHLVAGDDGALRDVLDPVVA